MGNGEVPQDGILDDFWGIFAATDWVAWVVKAAVAAPIVALITSVGPSWPDTTFIATATVIGQLIVLVGIYTFLRNRYTTDELMLLMRWVIATTILTGFAYLGLFARFVVPLPTYSDSVVAGYELVDDLSKKYEGKSIPSPRELLEGRGRKPDKIWTAASLWQTRLGLLVAWLLVFSSMTTMFGVLALLRRDEVGDGPDEED